MSPMTLPASEQWADTAVHVAGVCLGLAGAAIMLATAIGAPDAGQVAPAAVYAAGLIAMLGCSAAYNVWRSCRWREWLRRLDHAAIFVMIAGTYTPLSVRLPGAWGVALTAGVWAAAALGVVAKLCQPRRVEGLSVVLYLALGWAGLVALEPLVESFDGTTLALLLAGGVIYSAGVTFHLARSLPYGRALWHGSVLLAAAVHYAALLPLVEG
jgi:hemolysin III